MERPINSSFVIFNHNPKRFWTLKNYVFGVPSVLVFAIKSLEYRVSGRTTDLYIAFDQRTGIGIEDAPPKLI